MLPLRLFSRSGGNTGPWTAICFHPSRLDLASLRPATGEGPPVLDMLESFERGHDDADALLRLRRKFALQKRRCTTLLQTSEYQLLQLETPAATDPAARMDLIRARVQEMTDTPAAHATVDAFDIPADALAPGRPKNSYAVVAGNAAIAPKVQQFHHAGINLRAIDIPEMSQRNLATLCEQPNRALAFLTFDENGGLLTFTANGELFMFRRVDIPLPALLTDDLDRRSTLYDRVGLEVQRSLDNFDRQYGGFLPLSRLVIGPQPESTPLQGYLKDYLAIDVAAPDLGDLIDISAVPELRDPARQAQSLQVIGAALRDGGAA